MARRNDNSTDRLADAMARSAETMPDEARERVRARVMHDVRADSHLGLIAIMSHRLAVAVTAFAVLTSGVAYAAERSVPGDLLYQIKRGAETALVAVLPPGGLENRVLVRLAERRAGEAARLATEGATGVVVDEAIGQLREALREATSAEGPLDEADLQRIRKRGADAPYAARKAIDDAVATSGSGQESGGGQDGSGGATGTGSQKQGPVEDSGAQNGSQDAGQASDPTSSGEPSGETSGTATGR
ncbi:hypothetical protein [Anaerosoma tenue]|uniref:hypothetical protein n=1 Tax=Anaerosoma tenue TaxID=2933588 RepID=UPI002260E825|nr:hypothetical protein [Anaerosoma tenue]MCK8115113.1 hypothetical protein [Anaerosoma tenue]